MFLIVIFAAVSLCTLNCKDTAPDSPAPAVSTKDDGTEKGEQIVSEYLKRDSSPFRKTRVRLTIEREDKTKQIYVLETLRKQTDSETRSLTRILEPKEDNDAATLTIEKEDKPTVNINYIASRKQFRESGTNKIFFGGLTSQELLGEWDKYKHRLLSEKGGTYEVESTLKQKEKSVIARIVTHFGADDYLPRQLHLFNSDGKEIRTFKVEETREVGDKKIISRMRINNHVYTTIVTLEILKTTFPENISSSSFEREVLKP